jgi:hypothetical protein
MYYKMPKSNLLSYYQSPDFAAKYNVMATADLAAACSALWAIVDELIAACRAFLHPTSPNVSLSEIVGKPLSVHQLLTLVRSFALRLEQCIH